MALDYKALMAVEIPAKAQDYEDRDTILYALRVGLGEDPVDERQLAFVYERDLRSLPTFASALAWTRFADIDVGFGGPSGPVLSSHPLPDRKPDMVCQLKVSPRSALIYRLNGDVNPLHVDPAAARKAGFERPILHGLATYGVVGHAVLRSVCGYDPDLLTELEGRFSAPVVPGDTLAVELWVDGETVSLRAKAVERDAVVFNNGRALVKRPA